MTEKEEESVQRWTAKRRANLVLSVLKGETSVQEAARKHGLRVAEIEDWRDRYTLAAENALRSRPRNEDALNDEELKKPKQKIGEHYSRFKSSSEPLRAKAARRLQRSPIRVLDVLR